MGKHSRSPLGSSRSPKRRRDGNLSDKVEGKEERGRSRDRSTSRSRDSSSSRSRSPSSSRSRSRSRDRRSRSRSHNHRRSPSRSRNRDQRRSRGDDHRRSRSRSKGDDRRRNGGRWGDHRPSPPRLDRLPPARRNERGGGDGSNGAPAEQLAPTAAAEEPVLVPAPEPRERKELAVGPAGGVYIPPFKLAQMMAEAADKESAQYQRMTWDALRKSINGLVNKVNASNIKHILPEVFSENLVRGRGLLCRSIMKSQMASPSFTPVYAALVAVINTKFPEIGELLLHRVVMQFKRSYKRNDKPVCLAAIKFIAHLANQQVVHELLPLEVLLLLLESPSDDGVEVVVDFLKEVGPLLLDLTPSGLQSIMDRLRRIVSEGDVDTRTQYIVESIFTLRKANFEGKPAVPHELELVETDDQITHEITLEDKLEPQMHLDVFKEDPDFCQHEEEYAAIKHEILGEDESEEEGEEEERERGSGEESSSEDESSEDEQATEARQKIQDETQTNLVNLRRTIYLTIMSALDFEEAGHKLLKMGIPNGQEMELATMIIECCSNEKTFIKYYALLGERFCKLKREYADCFSECFVQQYQLIHRLETNKLRNTAKLFAHLVSTDAIPWAVLQVIRLTEDDTTSSSRIFIKILFQELAETMGLVQLNKRLNDPTCLDWFDSVFPKDSPRNMRFAINFFTSIGLGGLTDRMREILKNLPKMLAAQQVAAATTVGSSESESESDTSSSSSSDSGSSSSGGGSGSSGSGSSGSSSSDDSSSSNSGSGSSSSGESESEDEAQHGKGKGKGKGGGGRRRSPPVARATGRRGGGHEPPLNARPGSDRELAELRHNERQQRRDSQERQARRRSDSREQEQAREERRGEERRRHDPSEERDRRRR